MDSWFNRSSKRKEADSSNNSDNSKKKKKKKDDKKKKKKKDDDEPLPVTLLSGFLGSGKTTLLRHVLTSKDHQLKIAVIVNDMAELNIDGQAIVRTTTKKEEQVVTLENGCICCTLRGDLIREMARLHALHAFDYVLIESTGIAEPQQVAESFCVHPETLQTTALGDDDKMLQHSTARLDTCVTVVDAVSFPDHLQSLQRFQHVFSDGLDPDKPDDEEGQKSLSELLVEQVEFSNVVVLNKVDLVSRQRIETAQKLIRALNPKATVMTASFGKIAVASILNTGKFNMQDAEQSPGWLVSLKEGSVEAAAAASEAEEYGVSSFVYRARRPFHPMRLHALVTQFFCFAEDWNMTLADQSPKQPQDDEEKRKRQKLEAEYGILLRSKGTCWIAGRDDHEFDWHQAGRILQLKPVSAWYCRQAPEAWDVEDKEAVEAKMMQQATGERYPHGDRRQELVLIGTQLQRAAWERALNECLLCEEEELPRHAVTGLPVGAYPDPLLPMTVPYEGATSLFMICRHGQNQHVRVVPGFALTVHHLALNVNYDEANNVKIRAVKVWLDKSDRVDHHGVLLATLRPDEYEQHALSLKLLPDEAETAGGGGDEEPFQRRFRIEVVVMQGQKPSKQDLLLACEVHILGAIEPLPYSADDDEEEEDDEDAMDEEDEECGRGGGCSNER